MKYAIAALFLTLIVCASSAPTADDPAVARYESNGVTVSFHPIQTAAKGAGLCGTCSSLTGQSISILLNYILNVGVVGTCGKLCGSLKSKGASTVCNLACDLVGIKGFVAALQKADLDPIYLCDLLGICKHDDNGAGTLDSLTVTPTSAKQSSPFVGAMQVTVTNHTGAGEFRFNIQGGADPSSGASSVYAELAPGSYGVKLNIDTTPSDDPTQGPQWNPGNYTLSGEFCMGECGSKHPHSKLFGNTSTVFEISGI